VLSPPHDLLQAAGLPHQSAVVPVLALPSPLPHSIRHHEIECGSTTGSASATTAACHHPRTRRQIAAFGFAGLARGLRLTAALDHPVLLTLIRNAAGLVSDSGGIQEEATVLVVRRSNERPEAEQAFGARTLPGPGISQIVTTWLRDTAAVDARLAGAPTPFGDGTASSRLIQAVRSRYSEGCPSPPIQACEGQNGIIGGRPAWLRSAPGTI
jgi:hypothetical protein